MEILFRHPAYLAIYLLLAFALSFLRSHRFSRVFFLILNLAACYFLFFYQVDLALQQLGFLIGYLVYSILILGIGLLFLKRNRTYLAALIPILGWILIQCLHSVTFADISVWLGSWAVPLFARGGLLKASETWVGFSYLSFRLSLLMTEYSKSPSFLDAICYTFDPKTLLVGPINSYLRFGEFLCGETSRDGALFWTAALRIAVGLFKFYFISGIFYQLTLSRTFVAGSHLDISQFLMGVFAYTFYIYINFSGFCDVIIGLSAWLGLEVKENFDRPLSAVNIRQFWQRWHMSLTEYLNLMIFTPLSKLILRSKLAVRYNHFVPWLSTLVLTIMGLWHGLQWNYLIFAWIHSLGLAVHHYYRLSSLPKPSGHFWKLISWSITFCFITLAFFFFENSLDRVELIFRALFPL
jgi:D-alanyl-lipoteichoic acid acyltransferase DltB (MBOAT superfamily)